MASEANKTRIGAFIVGAMVLTVVGIMLFGSGTFFKESYRSVLFFKGSVTGLDLGAPVQLKGVTIGTVKDIRIVFDPDDLSFLNRVIIETAPGNLIISEKLRDDQIQTDEEYEVLVNRLIDNGLRAKLVLQSFLTGKVFVFLDFFPDSPLNLLGIEEEIQELPTLPSDLEAFAKILDQINFEELADKLTNIINGVEEVITAPELMETVRSAASTMQGFGRLADNLDTRTDALTVSLNQTLTDARKPLADLEPLTDEFSGAAVDARKLLQNLDKQVEPLVADLEETAAAAQETLTEAKVLFADLQEITGEKSPLLYKADDALTELAAAARAIRFLADFLAQHPESLLHGRGQPGE